MTPRAARSSTILGASALVGAAVAVAIDAEWLVIVAALLAVGAIALLLLPAYRAHRPLDSAPSPLVAAGVARPATSHRDERPPTSVQPTPTTGSTLTPAEAAVDAAAARAVAAATAGDAPAVTPPAFDLHADARSAADRFEADAIVAREELVRLMNAQQDRLAGRPDPAGVGPAPSDGGAPLHRIDAIHDLESGLFSEVFFDASLGKRVSASRRGLRPLSVAVLQVEVDLGTPNARPAPSGPVAEALLHIFREADTVARSDDGSYLVLLEDTPENGAVWSLERLRRRISETLPAHTTRAGVSCYPAYGFDADQLLEQARNALEMAKEWPQDRVEVTTESPD